MQKLVQASLALDGRHDHHHLQEDLLVNDCRYMKLQLQDEGERLELQVIDPAERKERLLRGFQRKTGAMPSREELAKMSEIDEALVEAGIEVARKIWTAG